MNSAYALSDPYQIFHSIYSQMEELNPHSAQEMALCTVSAGGQPSARMVLLKEIVERSLVFYTNYESRKGRELEQNSQVALLFYYRELNCQIRIGGSVKKVSRQKSESYFRSRPRGSQIAAFISAQSSPLSDRVEFQKRFDEIDASFKAKEIPLKSSWGGYCVTPHEFEFWFGKEDRMHERVKFLLLNGSTWKKSFLQP